MKTLRNTPAPHSEPSDIQLQQLVCAAAVDARAKAAAADRRLQDTLREETEQARRRFRMRASALFATTV